MKPDGALELSVATDFSQCAMNAAMDRIWEEIAPEGYHVGKDYYCLEIGVEGGLLKALDVCRAWGIDCNLNKSFEVDEWQLSCLHFGTDEAKEVILWCPGA